MKRNWKAGVCVALCSAMVFTGIGPADAVDGKSDAILEPGFHPVGVHVVAAGKQLVHEMCIRDRLWSSSQTLKEVSQLFNAITEVPNEFGLTGAYRFMGLILSLIHI